MKILKRKNFLEVSNRFLKFTFSNFENKQEFFVRSKNSWKEIAFGNFPELLANREKIEFIPAVETIEKNISFFRIVFSSRNKNFKLKTHLYIKEDCKYVHIVNRCRITGKNKIEYFHSCYYFSPEGKKYSEYKPLDFCWVPNLRPGKNYVIGDHTFRSPAIILQKGTLLTSLIPDIDLFEKYRKMKTALDLNIRENEYPLFSYGFKEYRNTGHTYYVHKNRMTDTVEDEELVYGYYLYFDGDAKRGYEEIVRFLWENFAEKYFKNSPLPAIPYENYAKYGYSYIFKNPVLGKFKLNRKNCAGIYTISFTSPKQPEILNKRELNRYLKFRTIGKLLHKISSEKFTSSTIFSDFMELLIHNTKMKIVPQIMNQSWFNNIRTGYGIYHYGKKWKDKRLISIAKGIKNLILNAPKKSGIFPSVCFTPEKEIIWGKGTKGFEYVPYYHIPDSSTTCYWILQWYRDLDRDKNLFSICKKYADFLIKIQLPSGAIPAWVDVDEKGKIKIEEELKESASTACSTMFLSELYLFEKNKKYLKAVEKGVDFLIREVIPENKWFDFETFFSCSKKEINMKDKYTGLYPQNNLCIYWSCETFKNLYKITAENIYLEWGESILNLLSLYQQIWDANFLSIYTFGGFGVMNTDAEWNDSRQALFSLTYIDYYLLTKKIEYLKRGISALNASFTLMLIPEHKEIAPGNISGDLKEKYYGAIYENYGHLGYDRRVPGYVMFDWGTGTACTAVALLENRKLMTYLQKFINKINSK